MISSVKDLVTYLETYLDPDELVLATWWTKDDVDLMDTEIVLSPEDLTQVWSTIVFGLESYVDDTISEISDALFDLTLKELVP